MKFYCKIFICFIVILCSLLAVSASTVPTEQNIFFDNGSSTKPVEERIMGGEEVESISFFPYQVQITEGATFCSGVIISENYILTPASCFEETRSFYEDMKDKEYENNPRVEPEGIQSIVVKAGSVVRGEGVVLPIQYVVHHPQFQPDFDLGTFRFNVAYMKTVAPIDFSDKIQPCILIENYLAPNFTVTGWETQLEGTSGLNVLREAEVFHLPYYLCKKAYDYNSIDDDMFCGVKQDGVGPCLLDDIGDPASIEPKVVLGMVISANYCDDSRPIIFTAFIEDEIRDFIIRGTGVRYYSYYEIPGITA